MVSEHKFYITTNKSMYQPGEAISGHVFLQTKQAYQYQKVNLSFEGYEETTFKRVLNRTVRNCHGNSQFLCESIDLIYEQQDDHDINNDKSHVYKFAFQYTLPSHLTSTSFDMTSFNDTKAQIVYRFNGKATVKGGFLKHKKNIRATNEIQVVQYRKQHFGSIPLHIASCFPIDGRFQIVFDKGAYHANETAAFCLMLPKLNYAEIKLVQLISLSENSVLVYNHQIEKTIQHHEYQNAIEDTIQGVMTMAENHSFYTMNSALIKVEYVLDVRMKQFGNHNKIQQRIPITILQGQLVNEVQA